MRSRFQAVPQSGYFLQAYPAHPPGAPEHFFGAVEKLTTVDCLRCEKPLIELLSLDCRDVRLDLPSQPGNRFPLLICPHCWQSNYTLTSAGEVQTLTEFAADLGDKKPFAIIAPSKSPFVLHAIPDRIMEVRRLALENRLDEAAEWIKEFDWRQPLNQIGGVPATANLDVTCPPCPLCSDALPFFANVVLSGSPTSLEKVASDAIFLYFICRKCVAVVGRGASVA